MQELNVGDDSVKEVQIDIDNVFKSKFANEDLKSALKRADIDHIEDTSDKLSTTSNDNKLASSSDSQSEVDPIKSTLSSLLEVYTNKLGYQVTYDGFEDALKIAISSDKTAREIVKSIQGDLASTMSDVLIFKSIIVIGRVIDSQLNGIMNNDYTQGLSGETVSILNQMFGWIEKLEEIKSKYSQFDISQKIKNLTSTKSDVTKRTELELHLIDILKHGVDSLAK